MSESSTLSTSQIQTLIKQDTINLFIKLVLVVMLLCFIFMLFSAVCGEPEKKKCDGGPSCTCVGKKKMVENYSSVEDIPNEQSKYVLNYNNSYLSYQRAELTAPNSTQTDAPKNLLFGDAERYIMPDNTINFNITANLYILNGNVYDSGIQQVLGKNDLDTDSSFAAFNSNKNRSDVYSVYISDSDTGVQNLIGNLEKDGDGLYKLKKTLTVPKESTDVIFVYYENGSEKVLVISGYFNRH